MVHLTVIYIFRCSLMYDMVTPTPESLCSYFSIFCFSSTAKVLTFLEEPEAYDVLFLGDSRFMNGMLPLEIWEDYGIAGYNLSCHGSSLPVTYWSLCNALDYAQPKLVVIAVDGVTGAGAVGDYTLTISISF